MSNKHVEGFKSDVEVISNWIDTVISALVSEGIYQLTLQDLAESAEEMRKMVNNPKIIEILQMQKDEDEA